MKIKKQLITTTFAQLHAAGACKARYRHLAKALGGITKYGRTKPINLLKILEVGGWFDFEWTIIAVDALEDFYYGTWRALGHEIRQAPQGDRPKIVRKYFK